MSRDLILTRENLLTRSEEFDHGAWTKAGSPVTTINVEIAPDGTLTADKLEDNNASGYALYYMSVSTYTVTKFYNTSLFIKKDVVSRTTRFVAIILEFTGSTSEVNVLNFDTSSGEIDSSLFQASAKVGVVDHGNYWRIWISAISVDQSNTGLRLIIYSARGASANWNETTSTIGAAVMWGAFATATEKLCPYSKTEASALAGPFAGLVITPEYDYKDTGQKFESRHRVRSGAEYVYKWGEWSEKKMSVAFVNSEFKSVVNSWWSSNADLEFQEDFNVTSVHLINKSKPVDGLVKPYNDLFRGKIELGTY